MAWGSLAPEELPDDPAERAALRQRLAVKPAGGRKEGVASAVFGSLVPGMLEMASLPGRAMQGQYVQQPEVPGQWSETDEALQQFNNRKMADDSAGLALNMVGVGSPFAQAGAAGMAGGRLGPRDFRPYQGDPADAMLAVHNTRADRLAKADAIGGFAVPSVAVVKPSHGFSSFGDISMIGDPAMVNPGRGNPVFASDVYSPRFPSLNDEGTKIFRGFTDSGNRRYAPLTIENLVREMKGNIRGGEGWDYGAGSVRSGVTPQFSNARELQQSRDRLIPAEQFKAMKDETNAYLSDLAGRFHPYSKYSGNWFDHSRDFNAMLAEYGPHGLRRMNEHYSNLPPELLDDARAFLGRLRDMPTEYFEAKPQRAVRINEFRGAVVPESEMAAVEPILQRHGVPIETYARNDEKARIAAMMRFAPYFMAAPPVAAAFGSIAPQGGVPSPE